MFSPFPPIPYLFLLACPLALHNEVYSTVRYRTTEKHLLPLCIFATGQRWGEDPDEHHHAAEEDLQPPVHVPTHRGERCLFLIWLFVKHELRTNEKAPQIAAVAIWIPAGKKM